MSVQQNLHHSTQYHNTVLPLLLAFTTAFFFQTKKYGHPHLAFLAIFVLVSWSCYHSVNFPFSSHTNRTMAPIQLMFVAYQFFLYYRLSPESLEAERRRHLPQIQRSAEDEDEDIDERNEKTGDSKASTRNWKFGYHMLWNARLIGTPWEAPRIRPRAPKDENTGKPLSSHHLKASLSRRSFLLRRAAIMFCRYLALCAYWDPLIYQYMPDGEPWRSSDFTTPNRFFFSMFLYGQRNVSRGLIIRTHLLLELLVLNCVETSTQHDVLAIIAVGLKLDSPDEWPPLYGNILEAYTLRRYWGSFWHLLVYRSFSALAEIISRKVLQLRKSSPMTRYMQNALVFAISGLMHLLVQWIIEPEVCCQCGCGWSAWFYIYQIPGIIIEVVQKVLLPRWLAKNEALPMRLLKRLTGYIWVICWIVFVQEATEFPYRACILELQE